MPTAFELIMEDRKKLVGEIVEQMKTGYFLTENKWDSETLRPQNPISGKHYHGGNRLKLMSAGIRQKYTDPRWMTAIQIRDAGYRLQKDAYHTGIMCEKWIFSRQITVTDTETGSRKKEEVPLEHPRVSFFNVYNAAYVEGLPPYMRQLSDTAGKMADDFIRSSECKLNETVVDEAFYSADQDKIYIPPRQTFKSDEAFLSVLWHEMSHSTGHPDRLNRLLNNKFGTEAYAKEELRAEISSLFVSSDVGLQLSKEDRKDYANYLKSWIQVLENDYNELFRACADAEKICNRLITNYEKVTEKQLGVQRIPTKENAKKQKQRR